MGKTPAAMRLEDVERVSMAHVIAYATAAGLRVQFLKPSSEFEAFLLRVELDRPNGAAFTQAITFAEIETAPTPTLFVAREIVKAAFRVATRATILGPDAALAAFIDRLKDFELSDEFDDLAAGD